MTLYIIKVVAFIPVIIALIAISLKLSQKTLMQGQANRHMKVLEVINLNKNNSLVVVKIGDKGCVLASSGSNINKIDDLTKEDILKIEENINQNNVKAQQYFDKYKGKIIKLTKKED
ncbi:MAG TPA: flagellar biosynthetic protein FliO [Peptostreptococcaceae bacterium]|nr:flagellar biosynthetic protein FliO [Peptostreptococcaceae bacterium]